MKPRSEETIYEAYEALIELRQKQINEFHSSWRFRYGSHVVTIFNKPYLVFGLLKKWITNGNSSNN